MSESQLLVVDPHQVENRGLDIVNMNGVLDRMKSEVISLADAHTASNSATCHPHRKRLRMMITTSRPI